MTELRDQVRKAYSAMALDPTGARLRPNGRELAEALGYPKALLDRMPEVCVDGFYGVAALGSLVSIEAGPTTVLDLGCGSGLDTVCIAEKVGPSGKVVGLDFSPEMLARAKQAVDECGLKNVTLELGDAESLPWPDASYDAAVVNGIFNLNLARQAIFAELARVLRPGGCLWVAELIAADPCPPTQPNPESWFT